ncbi:tartrate dehydrogenase [Kribbella lupini]|uniref:D-malate dehydrogenase (decarboxylating) n=1 Tax=Kribbella lupini TaxID=291602 RepID=A0ABN2BS05_9ACTN
MTTERIALIPGDGIGREVVPAALAVLEAVGRRHGIAFTYDEFDWSCERYLTEGAMMPADGLDRIRGHDAIFLGAVGAPGVPDHVSLWGLLIPIRRQFQQYVNLRPIRVFDGLDSPVRGAVAGEVDFVVVRENVEGEYSEIGGRMSRGFPDELAVQEAVFTRAGVTRLVDFGLDLAERRRSYGAAAASPRDGYVTSATKSNGIVHTMPFWDEIVAERTALRPAIRWDQEHIDALSAKLVLDPARFDVIVASNLFGDILSDLAAAVAGGIGIAPAANLNPARDFPSMFEPVHGSAPDIAGRGIANPIGAIWTAAMMLDHLGHLEAAAEVENAIAAVLAAREVRTPDLGGTATTTSFTQAVLDAVEAR